MFIVGGIHDDGAVAFDPVADSNLRVIERKGVDGYAVNAVPPSSLARNSLRAEANSKLTGK